MSNAAGDFNPEEYSATPCYHTRALDKIAELRPVWKELNELLDCNYMGLLSFHHDGLFQHHQHHQRSWGYLSMPR